MKMSKKIFVLMLSMMLVIGCAVGSTVAWLTATTVEVTNTFTVGNISIKLEEHKYDSNNPAVITETLVDNNAQSFKMIPGTTYAKDPTVTVENGSEACYVFVKVKEFNDPTTYLDYAVDSNWTKLTGVDGVNDVWYKTQDAIAEGNADIPHAVLKDNKVKVYSTVTQGDLNALDKDNDKIVEDGELPKLTFIAAAIQSANIENEKVAYNNLPDEFKNA